MKKARWLLLLLPLVAGVFWMRALASWRPKVVFVATGAISKLELSDDGKTLLVAQQSPPKLQPTRATLLALDARNFNLIWQRNNSTDFSNPRFFAGDSKILVDGGETMILNARDGQSIREFGVPYEAEISPDEKWIAVGDFDADGRVYINSPKSKIPNGSKGIKGIHILGKREDTGRAFAFSPDGKTFVVGRADKSGAYLDFYDTQTWKRTRTLQDKEFTSSIQRDLPFYRQVSWSQDGRFLLSNWAELRNSGNLDGMRLWRVNDSKKLAYGSFGFDTSAPFNDASVLAFIGSGELLRLTPETFSSGFEELLSFKDELITDAVISPDGTELLVGTKSGRIIRKRLK